MWRRTMARRCEAAASPMARPGPDGTSQGAPWLASYGAGAEQLAQAPSFHEFWFSVAGANPRIGFMAMANETCGRQCPVTNGPRRPAKIT